MAQVFRSNRKSSDEEIIRLNSIGLSLGTIAKLRGCHPTTVTLRLKSLEIPPADTRRAFMEDIFAQLPDEFKDSVADYLSADGPVDNPKCIKEYIKALLVKDIENQQKAAPSVSSAPTPTE
jgi:hypothetical protein